MSNQYDKRSKNDLRREHTERRTGEKHKHRVEQEKINEADKAMREFKEGFPDFCQTTEEYFGESET